MTYTVEVRKVVKSFGEQLVLDHVDLSIEAGTVFALLGPNGAGKTTMVRILATLLRPDQGTVSVAGHDLLADPLGVKRSISLTGQFVAVDPVLTGQENIEMMARLRRLPRRVARARTEELLVAFGLVDAGPNRVSTYSGGMRRRLDLAISMIEGPSVLFLDEPSTGLDPRSREQLWETVRLLADEGVTVLLTTQYLEEADHLADEIAVLDHGRIVAQDSADALKSHFGADVLRLTFGDDASFDRAVGCLGSSDAPSGADRSRRMLEVPTDATATDVHALLGRLAAVGAFAQNLSIDRPTLDDVFIALTGPDRTVQPREVA